MTRKELEDRLINFALISYELSKEIQPDFFTDNLLKQIIRSSTSAALNYAEAQYAESKRDFIHKVSIVLKELKETDVNLKILSGTRNYEGNSVLVTVKSESYQLVSIFYRISQTAKRNLNNTHDNNK